MLPAQHCDWKWGGLCHRSEAPCLIQKADSLLPSPHIWSQVLRIVLTDQYKRSLYSQVVLHSPFWNCYAIHSYLQRWKDAYLNRPKPFFPPRMTKKQKTLILGNSEEAHWFPLFSDVFELICLLGTGWVPWFIGFSK